jgi:RNA polymerase-binding protein DksA
MQTSELGKYREQLLELRDRLREDIARRSERIPEIVSKPGDIAGAPTHNADEDAEGLVAEVALGGNQEQIYTAVENALDRIDTGSFGKCQNCGRPIKIERLDALPYAAFCIQCEEMFESARRR